MGAVSLWTRLPALYLCTGPKKSIPHPSCQDRQLELVVAATQRRPHTVDELRHVIDNTAPVVAHNGHATTVTPLPKKRITVHLDHTGHDAEHHEPANQGREHSSRSSVISKTSLLHATANVASTPEPL